MKILTEIVVSWLRKREGLEPRGHVVALAKQFRPDIRKKGFLVHLPSRIDSLGSNLVKSGRTGSRSLIDPLELEDMTFCG